eukprot:CAMPEP_0168608380 /NCGR_PEP_ID=MMETSP0449_2-20121227/596_1 /TAXON_ID=1082188 /ORGANISM="Strombidium rassoulzadegani, Strain ras09" /LENGTH=93 /DNA_ID=CAMNT_0008648361 /DNA_START=47 /DNA_END=328 /DNA_ORIENTATION=-
MLKSMFVQKMLESPLKHLVVAQSNDQDGEPNPEYKGWKTVNFFVDPNLWLLENVDWMVQNVLIVLLLNAIDIAILGSFGYQAYLNLDYIQYGV